MGAQVAQKIRAEDLIPAVWSVVAILAAVALLVGTAAALLGDQAHNAPDPWTLMREAHTR